MNKKIELLRQGSMKIGERGRELLPTLRRRKPVKIS
jgi:hypothetical protein